MCGAGSSAAGYPATSVRQYASIAVGLCTISLRRCRTKSATTKLDRIEWQNGPARSFQTAKARPSKRYSGLAHACMVKAKPSDPQRVPLMIQICQESCSMAMSARFGHCRIMILGSANIPKATRTLTCRPASGQARQVPSTHQTDAPRCEQKRHNFAGLLGARSGYKTFDPTQQTQSCVQGCLHARAVAR